MAFEKSLFERLKKLEFRESDRDEFYAGSYPLFLEFFHKRIAVRTISEEDAKIGIFLVYGWMAPAKLDVRKLRNFQLAKPGLLKALSGVLDESELVHIVNFVGGSLIATSKYLHLMNPEQFGIWDRRVALAGYGHRHHYQIKRPKTYLEYLVDLRYLKLPDELLQRIKSLMPESTEMRLKEFALFHLGIQEAGK